MTPEVQAWIESQKPALVLAAESYLEESRIYLPRGGGKGKGGGGGKKGGGREKPRVSGSQLRNLLGVAQSEQSLAVLRNFLHYQMGRGSRGWPDEAAGRNLEQVFEREIGERARQGAEDHGVPAGEIEAKLLPLLLGYVIREYSYRCAQHGTSADG